MKDQKNIFRYKDEKSRLATEGPDRVYLFYGEEEYLKEVFAGDIRSAVFPEGTPDEFSLRRLSESELNANTFSEAVNALPFLTERVLVEVNNFDINKNGEMLLPIITDIPDYCTVIFRQNSEYTPDFRLKFNKYLREHYTVLQFDIQPQGILHSWVKKRFRAEGKNIEDEAVEHLMFLAGTSMNGLIPEIRKISASTDAEMISVNDVAKMAHHIPEADVFAMVEQIASGKTHAAFATLSELLYSKENDPIYLLSLIGSQFKKLFAAVSAKKEKKGKDFLIKHGIVKFEWQANKLYNDKSAFSVRQLEKILSLCADADFKMKSSAEDSAEILKELLIGISVEVRPC